MYPVGRRLRYRTNIGDDEFRIQSSLINLLNISELVDQQPGREKNIPTAIENVAVKNVVGARHFGTRQKHGERQAVSAHERLCGARVFARLEVRSDDLKFMRGKSWMKLME